MSKEILYWIDDGECLYSFKSKKNRDKHVKESNIVVANQFAQDGLRTFTTETIFTGDINKYKKVIEL